MSTKQKLTKEQKALEKKYLSCVLYYKNLNGESVRALASLYSLSVGTVSARIGEGKGVVALEPEITLEAAIELLSQVYVGNKEAPKVKPQTTPQQVATHMVLEKATRPQGIKSKEEYAVYASVFGYAADGSCAITHQQKSYIRKRVREIAKNKGSKALFVPDWINEYAPQRSLTTMNAMAHELFERMEEMISDYMATNNLPADARYAVRQALAGLAIEGVNPQGIERQCNSFAEVVADLEANNTPDPEKAVFDYATEWNEGKHSTLSFVNGVMTITPSSPELVHKVFEDLKDLDEAGYIY